MSWISNIDKHRISGLYIQMAGGLHRAVDAYVMMGDGLHKWAREGFTFALLQARCSLASKTIDGISVYNAQHLVIHTQTQTGGTLNVAASGSDPIWVSGSRDENNETWITINTPAEYIMINEYAIFPANNIEEFDWLQYLKTEQATTLADFFRGMAGNLTGTAGMAGWDVSGVTSMAQLLYYSGVSDLSGLSGWQTLNVQSLVRFATGTPIVNLNALTHWNAGSLQTMHSAFSNCTALTDISGIANWDVGSCSTFNQAFSGCTALEEIDLSWSPAPGASFSSCFSRCTSLRRAAFTGDLSGVTDISNLFSYCSSLGEVDFSGCDLSGVTGSSNIFWGCSALTDIYTPAAMPGVSTSLPDTFTDGSTSSAFLEAFHTNAHIWRAT